MPTFVDLGSRLINLNVIAYIHWENGSRGISVGLLTLGEGTWSSLALSEEWHFEPDSPEAQRLREAFKQVPHIPVIGVHAKAIS